MNKFLKNRNLVIVAIAVVVVILIAGFVIFSSRGSTVQPSDSVPTEAPVPTISAEDLGFTLKFGPTGKTIIASVEKTEGVTAIDYELSYNSKGDIPRGAIGSLDLTKKPVKKEITLGTCSDVCHYDEDVKDIKVVLKVTKDDGKVYESEKTLEPEQ